MLECANAIASERLGEAMTFAANNGLLQHLLDKLNYLANYGHGSSPEYSKCTLYRDFAPLSFTVIMAMKEPNGDFRHLFEGGFIFHGPADGFGSGAAPTFSVTTEPTFGWSLHT